jgi:hypothetical protein
MSPLGIRCRTLRWNANTATSAMSRRWHRHQTLSLHITTVSMSPADSASSVIASANGVVRVWAAHKQVKWIKGVEFVADFADLGAGQGGYNQDREFFGYRQSI